MDHPIPGNDPRPADTADTADTADPTAPAPQTSSLKDRIIDAVQKVYDPEIPVNIYELGLIYEIQILPGSDVHIKMTLTSPACPSAQELPLQVQQAAALVQDVRQVEVDVVFDPPWSPEKMSEEARVQLGMM